MKTILAVASGGGHWVQLLRLSPAFRGAQVVYMSTNKAYVVDVAGEQFVAVRDANMWNKGAMVIMACQVAWHVLRIRPDVVLTTGAAPGLAAIFFARLLGAKTIWVDSIANSEVMSSSGKVAKKWASLWLTQWPHLATDEGPQYWGAVI